MKGAVDPETLYTKQNCIGERQQKGFALTFAIDSQLDSKTGGGSFGKVYKGYVTHEHGISEKSQHY